MDVKVAVDCMGGDHGAHVTVPAVLGMLGRDPAVSFILVGRQELIQRELEALKHVPDARVRIEHASETVAMDESPVTAMRTKKDSSMRVAINLVDRGEAAACVSAGNTGALMAISRFVLKTLPGIDRPAIATILPTVKGHTHILDLGANVNCEPEHLLQFGIMCSELVSSVERKPRPTVGLLNIGVEDIKGSELVKRAAELMRASDLNFHGYVEGDDIYKGTTDIVVCDGFAGNVALKTSEGLAKMLGDFLKEEFTRTWWTKILAAFAWPILRRFRNRVDHRLYNGAALLGLKGIVVKSHGSADRLAFATALARAAG